MIDLAHSTYMRDLSNGILGASGGHPALADEPIRSEEIVPGINLMRTRSDVTPFHFDGTRVRRPWPLPRTQSIRPPASSLSSSQPLLA